jgi:peptide-methionine (S)-S-oxide reductase
MNKACEKIAFGGSCYWCTEAIYQSLLGVKTVEQGFVAPSDSPEAFSEAVIVHFNPEEITLKILTEIHLRTHSSTVMHGRRDVYRSAVYTFYAEQELKIKAILKELQSGFTEKLITQVLPFGSFKLSDQEMLNYYYSNPEKPFCKNSIDPKLKFLLKEFGAIVDKEKLQHLNVAD